MKCEITYGLLAETFVVYVGRKFDHVGEVKALVASGKVDYALFEAVSDRIELTQQDVDAMLSIQEDAGLS